MRFGAIAQVMRPSSVAVLLDALNTGSVAVES